jgi:hypothetical protein
MLCILSIFIDEIRSQIGIYSYLIGHWTASVSVATSFKMLDPLTAISLAGNVAQFVDFSSKIISRTRELTKSSYRATQQAYNAEILIRDLIRVTEQVRGGARSASASSIVGKDAALEDLCDGCILLSERMIKRLEKLKLEEGAGKRQAFLHALKSVWSQKELESEESQLAIYRSQLEFRVLTSFR